MYAPLTRQHAKEIGQGVKRAWKEKRKKEPPLKDTEYLTVVRASREYKISRQSIYTGIDNNSIEYTKRFGIKRVSRKSLEAYISKTALKETIYVTEYRAREPYITEGYDREGHFQAKITIEYGASRTLPYYEYNMSLPEMKKRIEQDKDEPLKKSMFLESKHLHKGYIEFVKELIYGYKTISVDLKEDDEYDTLLTPKRRKVITGHKTVAKITKRGYEYFKGRVLYKYSKNKADR